MHPPCPAGSPARRPAPPVSCLPVPPKPATPPTPNPKPAAAKELPIFLGDRARQARQARRAPGHRAPGPRAGARAGRAARRAPESWPPLLAAAPARRRAAHGGRGGRWPHLEVCQQVGRVAVDEHVEHLILKALRRVPPRSEARPARPAPPPARTHQSMACSGNAGWRRRPKHAHTADGARAGHPNPSPHLLEGDVHGPEHARDLADGRGQRVHLALRQPPGAVSPQAQARDEGQEAPAPACGAPRSGAPPPASPNGKGRPAGTGSAGLDQRRVAARAWLKSARGGGRCLACAWGAGRPATRAVRGGDQGRQPGARSGAATAASARAAAGARAPAQRAEVDLARADADELVRLHQLAVDVHEHLRAAPAGGPRPPCAWLAPAVKPAPAPGRIARPRARMRSQHDRTSRAAQHADPDEMPAGRSWVAGLARGRAAAALWACCARPRRALRRWPRVCQAVAERPTGRARAVHMHALAGVSAQTSGR